MMGSLLNERLLAARTRICGPVPTWPLLGSAMSPGVRAPMSWSSRCVLEHVLGVDRLDDVAHRAALRDAAGARDDNLIELRRPLRE